MEVRVEHPEETNLAELQLFYARNGYTLRVTSEGVLHAIPRKTNPIPTAQYELDLGAGC